MADNSKRPRIPNLCRYAEIPPENSLRNRREAMITSCARWMCPGPYRIWLRTGVLKAMTQSASITKEITDFGQNMNVTNASRQMADGGYSNEN